MKFARSVQFQLTMLALAALLGGCASDRTYQEGLSLIDEGRAEEGVAKLAEAQKADPSNAKLRKDWLLQRDRLILRTLGSANFDRLSGNWDSATDKYNAVLRIDPANIQAHQALEAVPQERHQAQMVEEARIRLEQGDSLGARELVIRVLIENPNHTAALQLKRRIQEAGPPESMDGARLNIKNGKPVSLQFRDASLRMVMEAISKTTGLNVLFDKDVKADTKVNIFVHDVPVSEAVDLILMQTQNTKRVLSENSILIYADNDAKAKDYADLKIRRYQLTNADAKQVQAMVKTMLKTKDMFVDEKSNAIIVRDTPQVIRMVEKLIYSMDQPEPEVMLDVDVMEVTRDRMMALGIDLPTSFGASTSGMTLQQFRNLTDANVNVTPLSVTINAQKTDNDINDLATPRIRVRNKEKAKFLVGSRLPVISTAAVPSTTATSPVYNTSVQYVDVGIKIEVEPTIHDDGEVTIRMMLEVSSNSGENPDAAKNGTIAYTISTRSVNTVLRLKDGQTEIIGGLIQRQDDSSASRIPGLGDIPVAGRLFGSQSDTNNKSEIILSITPHIVRSNRQPDNTVLEMWAGTENNFRFASRAPVAPNGMTVPATSAAGATVGVVRTNAPVAAATTAAPAAAPVPASAAKPAAAAPAAPPAASLKPFVISGPTALPVGAHVDIRIEQPIYNKSDNAEAIINFDSDHLKLVSVQEGEIARNSASGAKFSSDFDPAGAVHLSLAAGSGQTLPETGGALALLQFEVVGEPGQAGISITDVVVKAADGTVQNVPNSAPLLIDVQPAADKPQ